MGNQGDLAGNREMALECERKPKILERLATAFLLLRYTPLEEY